MQEIWCEIYGTNGKYFVSDLGNVKSKWQTLKAFTSSCYMCVNIYYSGKAKKRYIHRLVAEAFLDNMNNLPEVNHKDGDKLNNCVDNLEWCTEKENQRHRINVLHKDCVGKNNPMYCKSGANGPRFKDYILQIDASGNVAGRYESTIQAANAINGNASNISRCLSGKRYSGRIAHSYKGYKWVYEQKHLKNSRPIS